MSDERSVDGRITAEQQRLLALFADVDPDRLSCAKKLVDRAAFLTVTLEDLESAINESGPVSEYQNGQNQWGTKRSPEADLHVAMFKNLASAIKQLTDLLPDAKPPTSSDPLIDYITAK